MLIRAIFINLIFSLLPMNHALANSGTVHGVLRVVKGDVQIKSGKTNAVAKARIGEKVFPKDTIITGKDSRAKVVMVDKNEINISPETQLQIENYEYTPDSDKKNVLLNVIYGKVRNKVNQKYDGEQSKFQVKTPSAVAGVRGTDFLTGFNRANRQTQIVTFEGRVVFGVPGPGGSILNAVPVTAGMMTTKVEGQMPKPPSVVSATELASLDSSTKAETPAANGKDAGGSDNRLPASEDKKSDEPKKDDSTPATGNRDEGGAKNEGANGTSRQDGPQAQQPGGAQDSAGAGPAKGPAMNPNGGGPTTAAGGTAGQPGGATGPGPGSGPASGPGAPGAMPIMGPASSRMPASIGMVPNMPMPGGPGMGTMFDPSKDLAGTNFTLPPVLNVPQVPVGPTFNQPRPEDFLKNCVQCRDAITGGNARVIIKVKQQ